MNRGVTVSGALARGGLVPFEAQILLAHVLSCGRAWLVAHGEAALSPEQVATFDALSRRRRDGEPVAYLTGHREFFGLDLEVTPDVLIPRPETELLVELALERIDERRAARVLDLGSGSGAIALAIASRRPRAEVLGIDASTKALAIASRNAQRLGIANVSFVHGDWFDRLQHRTFDLIASNPPYVADDDPHLREGDLRFEPRSALAGGADGLDSIRAIVSRAPRHLVAGGWLLLEHGYDHAERVRQLMNETGFDAVESRRDLAGIPRATFGRGR